MNNNSKYDLSRFRPSREKMLELADEAAAQKRKAVMDARIRELRAKGLIGSDPAGGEPALPSPWTNEVVEAGPIDKAALPSAAAPPATKPSEGAAAPRTSRRWTPGMIAATVVAVVLTPLAIVAMLEVLTGHRSLTPETTALAASTATEPLPAASASEALPPAASESAEPSAAASASATPSASTTPSVKRAGEPGVRPPATSETAIPAVAGPPAKTVEPAARPAPTASESDPFLHKRRPPR